MPANNKQLPIVCHPAESGSESGLCHTCYSYYWANTKRGVTNERMEYLKSIVDQSHLRKQQIKTERLEALKLTGLVCNKCGGDAQPLSNFNFDNRRKVLYKTCKSCWRKKVKKWETDNPTRAAELRRKGRNSNTARKRGITLAQYDAMLQVQGGLCAICQRPETKFRKDTGAIFNLAIDHDHVTGKNRALLCTKCNALLGMAGDSITVIKSAIEYLKESSAL